MKQVVGIDVSKAKLDCLWLREPNALKVKTKVIANTAEGHIALIEWLNATLACTPEQVLIVMEATGVYHEAAAYTLHEAGFNIAVINPAQLKHYRRGLGQLHKTDKQDSLAIARYGATQPITRWQPEAVEVRQLKALLARLDALETDRQRERNRLEKATVSASSDVVIESIRKILHHLDTEIKRLQQQIDDHIQRHPQLKKDRQLLESIPGVGPVLSRLMLSVIHSRSFEHAHQVAAYLGVIPVLTESGIFKGRSRLSKKGPARIRAKLYMAAVVASRYNHQIMAQKARLLAKGKTTMQALGAAMRKLVHLCFGVIKNQTEYSPLIA